MHPDSDQHPPPRTPPIVHGANDLVPNICIPSQWAHGRLRELLQAVRSDNGARVSAVKTLSGDTRLLFIRGKKRAGLELTIELEWTGLEEGPRTNFMSSCSLCFLTLLRCPAIRPKPEIASMVPSRLRS